MIALTKSEWYHIQSLNLKWKRFKKKRTLKRFDTKEDDEFISVGEREQMIDTLLKYLMDQRYT